MTYPQIKLPVNFTGAGASNPIIANDPILSPGSLILFDALNSVGGFGSGVPADGAAIPNIAWLTAKAMLASSASQSAFSGVVAAPTLTGPSAFSERTAKSGLHLCCSQVNHVNGQGIAFKFPDIIKTYLAANPTHSYFGSVWVRTTRASTDSAISHRLLIVSDLSYSTNYLIQLFQYASTGLGIGTYPNSSVGATKYVGGRYASTADDSTGAKIGNLGVSGWNGTAPAIASMYANIALGSIMENQVGSTGSNNKHPSNILYRAYFEDLTVSGRSYATVDGLDNTKYTTDVLTAGGRFYGDTWTNPSTLP